MPKGADETRIRKLRALRAQATAEGWSNEQLDEALVKLYGKSRAAAKSK